MLVPAGLQETRMEICRACPELTNLDRCRKCGCFMVAKTRVKGARCPLGKWPTLEEWIKKNSNENCQKYQNG
jgi:hypothetical protein